jgi:hypothetical protein
MHSVTAPTRMMMANQVTAARPHVLGIGNAGFVGFLTGQRQMKRFLPSSIALVNSKLCTILRNDLDQTSAASRLWYASLS